VSSGYSSELATEILARLEAGESLRSICKDVHMPSESTVRRWAGEDVEGFQESYARARDMGLDAMTDRLLEIADDANQDNDQIAVQRSRLMVDTRKWILSKLAPKRYGDRLLQEISGPDGGAIRTQTIHDDEHRLRLLDALRDRISSRQEGSES